MNSKVSIMAAAYVAAVMMTVIAQMATQAAAQQQTAADQAQIDQGKITFAQKCSHCHGPNMLNPGTITPDLRAFPDDRTRLVTTVKNGKNNKMPPWADILSDDEIGNLWAFISSRRKP